MTRFLSPILAPILFAALLAPMAATPQEQLTLPRKRIGLALAGGGAKGLAHVGVLRWLEEHHIPVDAIAGTSMGGLVAGIYAGGRNSEEIQGFVDGIDWGEVLSLHPEYSDLAFRRKEDSQLFPTEIELGLKGGHPRLPAGLSAAHHIGLLLDEIGFPYSQVESFDVLPTPFRCVAADLLGGNEVVFRDGSLSQALRATMSLPAIFAPVSFNDMLLVDGGVVNNIPVDVVRQMEVDVVIAVDLGMARPSKDEMASLLSVAGRSIDIMIRRNELQSLKQADVVIEPAVLDFGTLQFRQVDTIIERGYEAAGKLAERLQQYAVNDEDWQSYLESRRRKTRPFGSEPQFVTVAGSLPSDHNGVLEHLQGFAGKPLDRKKLEKQLTRLTGLGPYDAAGYRAVPHDGETGLEVGIKQKNYGPPFLRPLFVLDSGQASNASFTIAARVTAFDFPAVGSEWRTDFSFGRIDAISTEYYHLAGLGGLFVAPRAFALREQQLIVHDGKRQADYEVTHAGGALDVGYNFGRYSEVRTGIEISDSRAHIVIGAPDLPRVKGTERIWATRWRINALNDGAVPTSGFYADTQLNWQFGSPRVFLDENEHSALPRAESFGQTWTRMAYARQFGGGWSGILRVQGGGTFAGAVQPLAQFRLGGPLRLGALEVGERRGTHFAYGSAGILKLLHSSPGSIVDKFFGTVIYEAGDAFDYHPELFQNGTVGIIAQTNLGVLFVGGSYGEQGRGGVYFSLGRIF